MTQKPSTCLSRHVTSSASHFISNEEHDCAPKNKVDAASYRLAAHIRVTADSMAQPFLDQLEKLVSAVDTNDRDLVCKHFFSGAALYIDGGICASLSPKGLAFKLPKQRCEELLASGTAIALRYFDKSPIKQGYILLPDSSDLGNAQVSTYLDECMAHASSADG